MKQFLKILNVIMGENKMINIIGTILGSSGYDCHTRNLGRAIAKITDARYTITAGPGWESLVDDKELDMIKAPPVEGEINLIITNPLYWRINTQAKRNFAFLVWEGSNVPKCFIKECLNPEIEYIFVPSKHTADAILKTTEDDIILDKVKLMPHGVDTSLFYPKKKPEKCIFFCNKGFRNLEDRGGVQYALRAYFEEFTDKDPVEMLLKINPAYGIVNLQKLIDQITPRKEGLPLLTINTENLPFNKMVDLYNKCTVFVSPTRAEAYNLPCMEALACGLPVITTDFGGQTDYITKENGWIISGILEQVKHDLMYEEVKWLTPDIKELRKAMREAFENKELVKKKSEKGLETARNNSWDLTAKKIVDLI